MFKKIIRKIIKKFIKEQEYFVEEHGNAHHIASNPNLIR